MKRPSLLLFIALLMSCLAFKVEEIHAKTNQSIEKSKLNQSLLTLNEPVLLWHTKSYIIRVDYISENNYKYTAWNISSNQSKKPNLILKKGQRFRDGSGGNHYYEFKNGAYTYVCRVNIIGSEDTPPGTIEVFKKGKSILYQPVVKVLKS